MPHNANNEQADNGKHNSGAADIAKRHQRGGIPYDNLGALQPDNGYKQPDTGRNTVLQVCRNGIHQRLTEFKQREDDENDAFDQNRGKGHLPGVLDTHFLYHRHY